jgi:quinoprotein glucose dehydrogenase
VTDYRQALTQPHQSLYRALFVSLALHVSFAGAERDDNWLHYGGNANGDRYSTLSEIHRENVDQLELVWKFDAGTGGLQTQPLVIDGVLYAYTTNQDVVAIDASNGTLRWRSNSRSSSWQPVRGLSFWQSGESRRVFASAEHYLYALDADTGAPISEFGNNGRIDLRQGFGENAEQLAVYMTSPGVIFDDVIITGFRTTESGLSAPGRVRAFDVHTGQLRWQFNLLPELGDRGAETWPDTRDPHIGGANAWAGMVVDPERELLFVPTGSATNDFYGGQRRGDNLFANSLVVLDARTGGYRWHFQAVHHDLWDRDFASPPVLLTIIDQGKSVDVVAQASKQGFVYVFERETGRAIFPIDEVPVNQQAAPGEYPAPTQPMPRKPAPFARQNLTAEELSTRSPAVNRAARETLASMRNQGLFTPIAVDQPTLILPGFDGGAEWGGQAVDRDRGVFYVNSNDLAWHTSLLSPGHVMSRGESLYLLHCAQCHGADRSGAPPEFPSLRRRAESINDFDMITLVKGGKGRMPGIPSLDFGEIQMISRWLESQDSEAAASEVFEEDPAMLPLYVFSGFKKFLDVDGYPAVAPPWGTLNAIDLNTGEYRWTQPLGFYPALRNEGLSDTGTENYGGPLVTAGGLLFIGATIYDRQFRAFDSESGQLLWQTQLPYAGTATPITYRANGAQYVVIACSGSRDRSGPQGAAYVAFRLPR